MTSNKVTRSIEKKLSDGLHSQKCSKSSASKPPGTEDIIKMKEKASEISLKTSHSTAEESKWIVLSCFNNHLIGKLPPGYTEPLFSVVTVSRSSIMECGPQMCFFTAEANEK